MMAAAQAGGIPFQELAQGIKKVSPKAAQLGIKSEELFTTIAALTSKGYETTKAVKMINSALEKGGKADVFKLATIQGKEFEKTLNNISNSTGATERAFNRVDSTLSNQWEAITTKLQNTGIKLGTALLPVIQKIIDKVSLFVDKFSEMDFGPFITQIEAALDRIFASIDFDKLVKGIGDFFKTLSDVVNLLVPIIEGFLKLKNVIGLIGADTFLVKRGFDAFVIGSKLAGFIGDLKTAGSLCIA